MSKQNPNLEIVEKAIELVLEDLRVFKDGGKSLYDWITLDFSKYSSDIEEIIKGAIK